MNKTLLYLMFFISSITLQAQNEYGLLIDTYLYPREDGEMNVGIYQISFNGGSIRLFPNENSEPSFRRIFFYVTPDNATKKIYFNCASTHKDCVIYEDSFIKLDGPTYTSFHGCYASSNISLIHITPKSSKTTYCIDEIIEFDNGHDWQYSYDGSNWVNFPSKFQSRESISFKISELGGYDNKKTIHFQTGFKTQFTNKVTYTIIPCSPNLVGTPQTIIPSCNNGNNGQVTFTFDRDLIPNERFLLNLTQIVNGNNLPPIMKNVSIVDFPNRQITFTDLTSGTYFLRYETFQNNGSTPTSDNTSALFSINQPTPLRFSITPVNPSCNGGNGEILIETVGGTPPYYYSINNGTKTQLANGSKTIPVPNGVYSIKVTDSNNCIEK